MSGGQMRCPIVFRGPNGAAARVAAQHSQNYGPWYASVPGLIVIAPYDASDAKGLLKAAIRSDDPVVFLEKDRKSTRLNSSHLVISYAVFCLKKKKKR